MKHVWRKLFILGIFIAISVVCASGAQAANYTIEAYDVNIEVNENNTFYITETIDVFFHINQHGIYRDIPLTNNITRLDGTSSSKQARVTDISVSEKYSKSTHMSDGALYKRLKIGDSDTYISGAHTYVIEYLYNLGKDPSPDYDELYFNIIGPEWDNTVINNITFTIKMPKEFDAEKLGFSSGRVASTDSSNVYYTVEDHTITGGCFGSLVSGEALTVRLELPEGYFVGASSIAGILAYLILIVFVLLLLAVAGIVTIRLKWGRDGKIIETVEFYPPDQLDSVVIGFAYQGKVTAKEFTSLFIYLANKGYIEIEEIEEDESDVSSNILFKMLSKKIKGPAILLTKKREYDGSNEIEKSFMDAVFKHRDQVLLSSLTTSGPECTQFTRDIRELIEACNTEENRLTIFDETSKKMRKIGYLLLLAILVLYLLLIFFIFDGDAAGIVAGFVSLFPICFFMVYKKIASSSTVRPKNGIASKGIGIVFILAFVFTFMMSSPFTSFPGPIAGTMTFPVLYVCVILAAVFSGGPDKRNEYGLALYGRIKGFRNFLLSAEKPKLETLVMNDPSYFYNILPYTYVLNVSKKWIEKFEMINLAPPEWYHGTGTFNPTVFCNSIDSIMNAANETISPSSSGSGGSSGGGSSGGGSGGGGGGSW